MGRSMGLELLLLLSVVVFSDGATINLDWHVTTYDPIEATVGDILVFEYTPYHNVYELYPGQTSCPDNFFRSGRMATLRGADNAGGGSGSNSNRIEIVLSATGVRTFACEVGSHCEAGQIVVVTVSEAPSPMPRTCADTNADGTADDAFDCSAETSSLVESPEAVTCDSNPCVAAECCTAVPPPPPPPTRTCADIDADGTEDDPFDCDASVYSLSATPGDVPCADDHCEATECCTDGEDGQIVWTGSVNQDLWNEYGNIFTIGNRNAASHLWASFILDRAWQMSAGTIRALFSSFCPVSGSPVRVSTSKRYRVSLNTVSQLGGQARTSTVYFCCWPCLCDTYDFLKLDTKTVMTADGLQTFWFTVIGNPCVDPDILTRNFVSPFDGSEYTLAQVAREVRCTDSGQLISATLSDNGYPIIGMVHDSVETTEELARSIEDPVAGRRTPSDTYGEYQDGREFSLLCASRADSGYNSGMGEIFRHVAGVAPIDPVAEEPASPPASVSRTCADIDADGVVDDAFDCSNEANSLAERPGEITCGVDACVADECCTVAPPPPPSPAPPATRTCADIDADGVADDAFDCSNEANSLAERPGEITCGVDACVADECCTVTPPPPPSPAPPATRTCADIDADGVADDAFDCSNEANSLAERPGEITCGVDACVADECCTVAPPPPPSPAPPAMRTCADIDADGVADDAFDCSNEANSLAERPGEITCGVDACVADECCTLAPPPPPSPAPPATRTCADIDADGVADDAFDCSNEANSLAERPGEIICGVDACVADECCTVAPPPPPSPAPPAMRTCADINAVSADGASGDTFDCSAHANNLHESPEQVACATDPCDESECCTISPDPPAPPSAPAPPRTVPAVDATVAATGSLQLANAVDALTFTTAVTDALPVGLTEAVVHVTHFEQSMTTLLTLPTDVETASDLLLNLRATVANILDVPFHAVMVSIVDGTGRRRVQADGTAQVEVRVIGAQTNVAARIENPSFTLAVENLLPHQPHGTDEDDPATPHTHATIGVEVQDVVTSISYSVIAPPIVDAAPLQALLTDPTAIQTALENETGTRFSVQSVDAMVRTTPIASGERSVASSDAQSVAEDPAPVAVTLSLISAGVLLLGVLAAKFVCKARSSDSRPKLDEIEHLGKLSGYTIEACVSKQPNDGTKYAEEQSKEEQGNSPGLHVL